MMNLPLAISSTDFDDTTRRSHFLKKMVSVTQPLYRRYFGKHRPQWQIRTEDLQYFPVNSLGQALHSFLSHHHYRLMSKFESHDVYHVLLDYKPTTLDEACMQFCLIGSGKRSLYALVACLGSVLIYPEYCAVYYQHYRYGKRLKNFANWDFEALLTTSLHQLKKEILR